MKWSPVIIGAAAAALFLGGFLLGRGRQPLPEVVVQVDSLVRVDTIREEVPIPVEVLVRDSIRVEVLVRDSVLVPVTLPRETRTYKGADYSCQVSGFRPSLDWFEVYPVTKTVTRTITETIPARPPAFRWSVSAGADFIQGLPVLPFVESEASLRLKRWEGFARGGWQPRQGFGASLGVRFIIFEK